VLKTESLHKDWTLFRPQQLGLALEHRGYVTLQYCFRKTIKSMTNLQQKTQYYFIYEIYSRLSLFVPKTITALGSKYYQNRHQSF